METRVFRVDARHPDAAALAEAGKILAAGGIVGMPTETVYGLAVNAEDAAAVRRLLELRRSPEEKKLTVHLGSEEEALRLVGEAPPLAHRLMHRFWPGPLTIVLTGADGEEVGLRLPAHPVARDLVRAAGVRVVAPSANLSGGPPARSAEEVMATFSGAIDAVIDAGPAEYGKASTVVRIRGRTPEILRDGAVDRRLIRELDFRQIAFVCTGNTCRSPIAESLFRKMLARKLGVRPEHLPSVGYRVLSAGTAAGPGGQIAENAAIVLAEYGCDASRHRTQPVTIPMVEESDRVFCMERGHRDLIARWMPGSARRIALLDPSGADIPDPFGGDLDRYRATAARIRQGLEMILDQLDQINGPAADRPKGA